MTLALKILVLFLGCFANPGPTVLPQSSQSQGELVSEKDRRSLRGIVSAFCRLGRTDDVEALCKSLFALGATPEEHAKLQSRWDRELTKAKPKSDERTLKGLRKKLTKPVRALERQLSEMELPMREELARVILTLDSESSPANLELGHVQSDGRWWPANALRWHADAARVTKLSREARSLDIPIDHARSENPTARAVFGEGANQVSAHGVYLHGGLSPAKMERILRETLRAAAFSRALLDGKLEVPRLDRPRHLVMMSLEKQFSVALEEATLSKGIPAGRREEILAVEFQSFQDGRGWRTTKWRMESDFEALILWIISPAWLGYGAQPCLLAGHLNWLSLNFFGTTLPTVAWKENAGKQSGTSAERMAIEDALWRSASASLFGCRSWMKSRMSAGHKYPYSRAIVTELGMVAGEALLKATLVNEYLQGRGDLRGLFDQTNGKKDRVGAIETGLGRALPDFEEEWASWLFDAGVAPGLLQRIGGAPGVKRPRDKEVAALLGHLEGLRKEAFKGPNAWHEDLEVFEELSSQAKAHARYLTLNPEQGEAWPDAHEEYPDREGFSPEGAWSGGHSVIDFGGEAIFAVDGWMGTFYHRLPLLNPGLFGLGYGRDGKVVVLDSGSLVAPYWGEAWIVWPPEDARDVSLSFRPELPNPVPGENQAAWGYPITVQIYAPEKEGEKTLVMTLHQGDSPSAEVVPCHYLTPSEPAFEELAPKNAYCLIPKKTLKPGTTYTVRARCVETKQQLVWSFKTGR